MNVVSFAGYGGSDLGLKRRLFGLLYVYFRMVA